MLWKVKLIICMCISKTFTKVYKIFKSSSLQFQYLVAKSVVNIKESWKWEYCAPQCSLFCIILHNENMTTHKLNHTVFPLLSV